MIYTVTGAMPKQHFGRIFMHEHVGCISNDLLHTFGEKWLDIPALAEYASRVLVQLQQQLGIGLFVDGTPIDLGRDVRLLKDVSMRAGVPIVASAGLYWFPACSTSGRGAEEIASWFLEEWKCGMENTDIKPGILKCASDTLGITEDNKKRLTALGIVQSKSGLPLYVHSIYAKDMAPEQLRILREAGANPEKIVFGHAGQRPDADHLALLLKEGCYIVMDQCHCSSRSAADIGSCLAELCRRGYGKQLLLANDLCIYSDFGSKEWTGMEYTEEEQVKQFSDLFVRIYPEFCKAGGDSESWERMFCENSIDVLDV